MGLFGALFTGVSALNAQSQTTAIISNNIANVNTTGFKRSEASFFAQVTSSSSSSAYSPGTVTVSRTQDVGLQGSISQSTSSTDTSIAGDGFFAIKRDNTDSALNEFLYTRNGQFFEDSQGFLQNTAGFFLYGWPLDVDGNLPSNQGDLDSLVPVDIGFQGGLTRPTSAAELSLNLDAREQDNSLTGALTASTDFTRTITVFDSLGTPQDMTVAFTKTYGPQATAVSSLTGLSATDSLIGDLALTEGHQFTISDGTVTRIYEVDDGDGTTEGEAGDTSGTADPVPDALVQTVGDILNDINDNFTTLEAYIGNNGELFINQVNFTAGTETVILTDTVDVGPDPTLVNSSTALNDLGFTVGTYTSDDLDNTTYSNGTPDDAPEYSSEGFPAFQFLPGDAQFNPRGFWQVSITDPNNNTLTRGLINFNSDGTINAQADTDGNIDIEIQNIDWGNGSDPTQNIELDISAFSQFASDYNVLFSDQNGAELGLRTGVEIDRDGFVVAQFSNGATTNLYKLPLVTFSNPNGLTEQTGTAYTESGEAGEENLRESGSGGAGVFQPSSLENSNVDLADEFALLIVAQRAYSAGTKVINTVDQMTQELLQLR